MKKTGLILSSVLFAFFIILSSSSFAHESDHEDVHEKGKELHKKMDEGSGSSAVQSEMGKAKEYKSGHEEAEEEGSFSYKRHRKEMSEKKKSMQEGAADKMQEGSGKD
jgi:hypothetical protein